MDKYYCQLKRTWRKIIIAVHRFIWPDHKAISKIVARLRKTKQSLAGISSDVTNAQESLSEVKDTLNGIKSIMTEMPTSPVSEMPTSTISEMPTSTDGQGSPDEYIKYLQKEVSRMRDDTNLKLMRKYVLDTQIRLYLQIANRLHDLGNEEELRKVLELIKSNLSEIGVSFSNSSVGSPFNPMSMQLSLKDSKYTNDKSLDKTVACSIAPGFIWTVPIEGSQAESLVLKREEVVLWQYTEDESRFSESENREECIDIPTLLEENTSVQEHKVAGYFVMQLDNEITSVIPIRYGMNIYGSYPVSKDNVSCHRINILNDSLAAEHFFVYCDNNTETVLFKAIDETFYINSPSNHPQSMELETGDMIVVDNIKFTFIDEANE